MNTESASGNLPTVSVVIPVYNKERYIDEFLQILKSQTLKNMEFIFVDDKGQDNTFAHIAEAAKNDSRFVCIDNVVNRGPGYSRNVGIEAARGEYIAFADVDDIVSSDFYELLYNKAKETGALIVKGRLVKRYDDGREEPNRLDSIIRERMATAPTMLNVFPYAHTTAIFSNKLVRETGARNAPDSRNDEDTCFLMMVTQLVKPSQFALEDAAVYIYRQVEASLVHCAIDGAYLEQIRRSALFKLDYLLPRLYSAEEAKYIANTFELRLGQAFDDCEQGGADWEQMVAYINAFAERLKIWKDKGGDLYRPGGCAKELESYNFNGETYCRLRRLQRLERKLESTMRPSTSDLKWIWVAFNYKKLRRRCFWLKVFSCISSGKRKKKNKAELERITSILQSFHKALQSVENR